MFFARMKSYKERLFDELFGVIYYKDIPKTDSELFVLWMGFQTAKLCFNIVSAVDDDNVSKKLSGRKNDFSKIEELVKGYICETKGIKKSKFHSWYNEMAQKFEQNKEDYTERIKLESRFFTRVMI